MKKSKKLSILIFTVFACFATFIQATNLLNATTVYAATNLISNGNFDYYPSTTSLESNPNGWTAVNTAGSTSGVINVTASNTTFANSYYLSSAENPGRFNDNLDKKVLMLNAKSSSNSILSNAAFKSSSAIKLDSYSSYKLTALVYTQSSARASVYISEYSSTGLSDKELVSLEYIANPVANKWEVYTLYLSTGLESKNVQIELMLGDKTSPSNNAVFFDNITLEKISADELNVNNSANSSFEDLNRYEDVITNNNFEQTDMTGWTKTEKSDNSGLTARIMNITTKDTMNSYNLEYLGGDKSLNNENAMVIYGDTNGAYGVQSEAIEIQQHGYYKISANVKVGNGSKAYVVVKENEDVINFYKNQSIAVEDDFYTPISQKIEVASNSSNELKGQYTTVSFLVKGHQLFNTSINIELWLGHRDADGETLSKGVAVFDNITVEQLSYDEYTNYSAGITDKKVELTTIKTNTTTIANAFFNNSKSENSKLSFPVKPSDWTQETTDDTAIFGIINTNKDHFNTHKSSYGNIANPESKSVSTNDTNNLLMIWNKNATTQSVLSPTFSVSSNSYYELEFDLKTQTIETNEEILTVYIIDNEKNVVYADENVKSTSWSTYKALIKTGDTTQTLQLKLTLGAKESTTGYAFIDNVKLNTKTMTDIEYANYAKHNKVIDYTNGHFNLKSENLNKNGIYDSLSYTSSCDYGHSTNGYGGVIDGENNIYGVRSSEKNTNVLKNMLVIETANKTTHSLTNKNSIDLQSDETEGEGYYKFSIYIKTLLPENVELEDNLVYGAEFALSGLDEKITGIVSNEEFTLYEIFVHATQNVSVSPKFSLTSQNAETKGIAFFDNFSYEKITENVFTSAFDEYEKNDTKTALFIGDTDIKEEDEEQPNANENSFDWLLIPSLIMSLAVVIGIVGFALRKIKFKKWQKEKIVEYDRNITLYRDAFRKDAENKRNEEVKVLQAQIDKLNEEIKELEESNAERMKREREDGHTAISNKIEREFKSYAAKHTALKNKVEVLENKLEYANTDEYLLEVQKKLHAEQLKSKKNLMKQNEEK